MNREQHHEKRLQNCHVGERGLSRFGWLGILFRSYKQGHPIGLIVYALATLTQPTVAVFVYFNPHSLFGLRAVEIANAVTYAFVGLIVETIRRSQILHTSN